MARPSGSQDKKPRVPYGSKGKLFPGIQIEIGKGLDRFAVELTSGLIDLDAVAKNNFIEVVDRWTKKYFLGAMKDALTNTMWARSRKIHDGLTAKITGGTTAGPSDITMIASAIPGAGTDKAALTLEFGRPQKTVGAGGEKGGTYMVPLASWLRTNGLPGETRNFATKGQITRDLAQPGVFFPKKTWNTKAGPARIFFVYKNGVAQKAKIKRDKRGRKITRGTLRQIAIAMYLAYKGETGIYGASKAERRAPRAIREPMAAQFGLTDNSAKAPSWFTRGAANSLGVLYRAINAVRLKAEAFNIVTVGNADGLDMNEIVDRFDFEQELMDYIDAEAAAAKNRRS